MSAPNKSSTPGVSFRNAWRATFPQLSANLILPATFGLYTASDITRLAEGGSAGVVSFWWGSFGDVPLRVDQRGSETTARSPREGRSEVAPHRSELDENRCHRQRLTPKVGYPVSNGAGGTTSKSELGEPDSGQTLGDPAFGFRAHFSKPPLEVPNWSWAPDVPWALQGMGCSGGPSPTLAQGQL